MVPRFSPDGRRIAFEIANQQGSQIWLYDLAKETLTRFTFEGANIRPVWVGEGKHVAFTSDVKGGQNIFWQLSDGSGGFEQLTSSDHQQWSTSASADGQLLAFAQLNPDTQRDILILRLSDRKVEPFLHTRFNETLARFSPDGHWLAYMSDESGRYEIYVQPYPGPGGKFQISTEGGADPLWNHNGR